MNNEKLTKTTKVIDKVLDIFQKVLGVGGILIIAVIIMLAMGADKFITGFQTVQIGSISIMLYDSSIHNTAGMRTSMIITMVAVFIGLGITWYGLRIFREILKPMKEGRPFEMGTSGKIRKLAWIILIGGLFFSCAQIATQMAIFNALDLDKLFNSSVVRGYNYNIKMDLGFVITAVILFLLAHIFNYGEQLQTESDETL